MGNLHLVTGYAGQAHVTPADHGSLFEATIRGGDFVMEAGSNFGATVVTNNIIKVSDGELMMQGRHVKLNPGSYVELAVDNGAQGYLRQDLIVARYTKDSQSGVEDCNLVVLKGTQAASSPKDPSYTTGSINAENDIQHDFPLYRICLNGITVETLEPLFEVQANAWNAFVPASCGIGGSLPLANDLDSLINTGWYKVTSDTQNAPFTGGIVRVERGTYVFQEATSTGDLRARRIRGDAGAWGEWEYENPPILLGKEYRTTERFAGNPVYVMRVATSTSSSSTFGSESSDSVVTVNSIERPGFSSLVRVIGKIDGTRPLPYIPKAGSSVSIDQVTGTKIDLRFAKAALTGSEYDFVVYYTKE